MSLDSIKCHFAPPSILNVATLPLQGKRLIEASAGTGKTHTITNIYLRLLINHGNKYNKALKPLTPKEILVVTFTDAATQELKDRIRTRIHLAQSIFSGKIPIPNDSFLQQIYQECSEPDKISKQLLLAERQMDEAAIYTIHGFCHYMLNQYAFESSSLFNMTLLTDEKKMIKQAANDYWRTTFYNAPHYQTKTVYYYWKTPSELLNDTQLWLNHPDLNIITYDNLSFAKRCEQIKDWIDPVKNIWLKNHKKIIELLNNYHLNKKTYTQKKISQYANDITLWANEDTLIPPKDLFKFSSSALTIKIKKDSLVPKHQFFDKIEELQQHNFDFKDILIKEAIYGIKKHLSKLKQQHNTIGFNDLLTQFDATLQNKGNNLLRQQIIKRYPVALIDEFQDTDFLQYRIFKTLYETSKKKSSLIIIGDPKQAIYAFRGGDIFTYINAKYNITKKYTLSVNWRSTESMINGCNYLFQQTKKPFIYDEIPFSITKPSTQSKKRFLTINNKASCAITLWHPSETASSVNKEEYIRCMTKNTVFQIKELLEFSDANQCTIVNENSTRNIQANDIAILVRTSKQAKTMRTALSEIGIPSVYMSEQESVFKTMEALDIYRILQACLYPEKESLLRSALSTALLNCSASTLESLSRNEVAWEKIVKEFTNYLQIWKTHGVLCLIRKLMFNREITQQLLSFSLGERRLTDIIHISNILSEMSEYIDTPQALLTWLWHNILQNEQNDTFYLHLESDKNLVKIITIHKSKGLEYPIVFIPYVCDWNEISQNQGYFFHKQPNNKPTLDLTYNEKSKEAMVKERLAEDIRLFYVGITRAIYKCYLGIAPIKKGKQNNQSQKTDLHKTAIGYLLNNGDPIPANMLKQLLLDRWCYNKEQIQLSEPLIHNCGIYKKTVHTDNFIQAKTFNKSIECNWKVSSYSTLNKENQQTISAEQSKPDDTVVSPLAISNVNTKYNIFTFPKGPHAGIFLHTLFEQISFITANISSPTEIIEKSLLHAGFEKTWQSTLELLVSDVLNTPLHPYSFCLGDISDNQKYSEMEFYIPIATLDSNSVNKLIQKYDSISKKAEYLKFSTIQGMLKGFIDLIFVHNDKYYIADYKSNYLGESIKNYENSTLETVMIEHRYDFQYQLYTLSLHRLLSQRLHNYNYKTHFGGVFYLYLRGMQRNNNKTGIFYTKPCFELIDKLDKLFQGII